MSKKQEGEKHHKNVNADVIRRACNGDSRALGEVITHYQNYLKAVIITTAVRFDIDPEEISVDDLAQIVWVKFVTKRLNLFKDLD